jgi:4-alpha-glucanotransferase
MSHTLKKNITPVDSFLHEIGRKAGVGLHFSSLPGKHGIGDIADSAISFIDNLSTTGIAVWQFLPTCPTGFGDSPYQSLSVFAGNPMLIGLDPLVRLGLLRTSDLDAVEHLPADKVDYGQLVALKHALLKHAAGQFFSGSFPQLKTAYEEFMHQNDDPWLNDYAQFRTIKTLNREQAWPQWDKPYRRRHSQTIEQLVNRHQESLQLIKFTQFLFEHQWQGLRSYAAESGISLFGDMPIYVAMDSADAWSRPDLLQLNADGQADHVAGVPADYFSEDGQLWGNPLYDWSSHKHSDYSWWIKRVRQAVEHTDLIRIDHFRGFESYWSVPAGESTARNGSWQPGPGDELFEAIREALGHIPIVAEDLGLITDQVTALRLRHGIPGMRVLQFDIDDADFDPADIEQNCVCYTATHDNDTTIGWFNGGVDDTRDKEALARSQTNALKFTAGSPSTINLDMIKLAFSSQAALAIAPIQDYLGLGHEARLNRPGTRDGNWSWRLREEDLTPAALEQMAAMVTAGGRAGPDQ